MKDQFSSADKRRRPIPKNHAKRSLTSLVYSIDGEEKNEARKEKTGVLTIVFGQPVLSGQLFVFLNIGFREAAHLAFATDDR